MSCTIGAPAPTMFDPAAGAPAAGPATTAGGPGSPSAAVDGAVAGAQGGAVSAMGGGGTAVAGAAGAVGTDQLVPVLQQLTEALQRLATALQPAAGAAASPVPGGAAQSSSDTAGVSGGGATTPTSGCGCSGDAAKVLQQEPRGAKGAPEADRGAERQAENPPKPPTPPEPARASEKADPAMVARWVSGDKEGLDENLLAKLAQVGERMGQKVDITSGNRTREEQEVLYRKYLNGSGNLAAKPGSSNHEHGDAADVKIGGVNLASNAKALKVATELGLHFPVPGEPWHVEVK